jgi:hypothetical protein
MGASARVIERRYGHLTSDSLERGRGIIDAVTAQAAERSGVGLGENRARRRARET